MIRNINLRAVSDRGHFAFIDALRGYAILGVVSIHAGLITQSRLSESAFKLAWSGAYGVQLFFMASAITLMMSWNARNDGPLAFYIRRLFRIAPMFWAAIPFYLWFNGTSHPFVPNGISWWHILMTAAFLHGWHPETINTVVPGGWSIAVEMTFYLIFPVLVVILNSWLKIAAAIIGSLVLSSLGKIALLLVFGDIPSLPAMQTFWFFSQFPVFIIGIATYYLMVAIPAPKWLAWTSVGTALVLIFFVLPFHRIAVSGPAVYALTFGLLAYGLANGATTAIVNAPVCFLGKISYSFYLLHWIAIRIMEGAIAGPTFWPFVAGVVAITVPLSWMTYIAIERPFVSFGNRLIKVMNPPGHIITAHDPEPIALIKFDHS